MRTISPQCASCGEQFTLGRKIYHECSTSKELYGSLFSKKIYHAWNSSEEETEDINP